MDISLCKITKELALENHWEFQYDPDFLWIWIILPIHAYSEQTYDAQYKHHIRLGREYLAVMLEDTVIGEIICKKLIAQTVTAL